MINAIEHIPVEYFKWGQYPDHFKIEMPHRHEFAELLFFTQGGGIHEINYKNYQINQYAIHYVPKSVVHFLNRTKESNGFTISFDESHFENSNTHKFLNPLTHQAFALQLNERKFNLIKDQVNHINHQIKNQQEYFQEKCFLLSMELLTNTIAAELSMSESKNVTTQTDDLVRRFNYQVKTNIHRHQSVAWYAQQLHVSEKYLSNKVKKSSGVSAKKYLLDVLLINVKRALFNSNKSIKQIAFDHNFSESALGKLFKKHVGCTMKNYRSAKKME